MQGRKLSQRWRQRRRKPAGRPTLYPGKVRDRHVTGYFTVEGWDKLAEIRRRVAAQMPGYGQEVSVTDALEMAVHHLHDHLTEADPERIPA